MPSRKQPGTPPTLAAARAALRRHADPEGAKFAARFFKSGKGEYAEGDRFLGVRVPRTREVAREFRELALEDVGLLFDSPHHEERLLGIFLLVRRYQKEKVVEERRRLAKFYLSHLGGVNHWDLVDSSAPQILGAHLLETGEREILYRFARSRRLWERRVAVLATFAFIRAGEFADTLAIAKVLLRDPHDLIHKAVGWMLREIGIRDARVLHSFLSDHCREMPRTMLRYAIEKLPQRDRARYLAGEPRG